MISPRGAQNRTTLKEMAFRAGYPLEKILKYYPAVTSLGFEIDFKISFPVFSPDDDIAVAIDGVMVYDFKRNASDVKQPVILRTAKNKPLSVGQFVQVFTFDEQFGIKHFPWRVHITYEDGGTNFVDGGGEDSWSILTPPRGRTLYFENGEFLIPPPINWPRPSFMPIKHDQPKRSTRVLSKPKDNPLFS